MRKKSISDLKLRRTKKKLMKTNLNDILSHIIKRREEKRKDEEKSMKWYDMNGMLK